VTDFRALCAELAEDLGLWLEFCGTPSDLPDEESTSWSLVKRAHDALKNQVEETDEDAIRYRWIKDQTNLNLRTTCRSPWTNVETGETYYPSHNLDVNGTGFSGIEHLDDLIDSAMELYPLVDT
jgi:hypothetical protein